MSNTKHTPGPWTYEYRDGNHPQNNNGGWGAIGFFSSTGIQILGTGAGWSAEFNEPTLADANLIAAAPELLEAAKAALKTMKFQSTEAHANLCEQLMLAIAKAEGK